jgi:hypothetical protein
MTALLAEIRATAWWLRRGHLPWHYRWCPGCIARQIHNRRVIRKLRRLI